ncbi:hypothetical protein SD70_21110 [Gordoniibacillus kamchatkensis]|uniref:Uncharacterized protein n=1 Tax=Gordoniibacillus kamchatkensis TaxID=1590651 RepID=A0ABR5AE20_9BACL|nr:hypothetical protein SD70_21110 [Paenibacillus sp. VKM B-2647]
MTLKLVYSVAPPRTPSEIFLIQSQKRQKSNNYAGFLTATYTENAEKRPNTVSFLIGMVEARGFEPLSENIATQASTGVVTVLMSPSELPVTGFPSGQPDRLLPLATGGG